MQFLAMSLKYTSASSLRRSSLQARACPLCRSGPEHIAVKIAKPFVFLILPGCHELWQLWLHSNSDLRLVSPRRLAMADSYVDFDELARYKVQHRNTQLCACLHLFASFCHPQLCMHRQNSEDGISASCRWGVYHFLTLKGTDLVLYLTWL